MAVAEQLLPASAGLSADTTGSHRHREAGRAVQVVECSLFKDVLLPSPELFDELWDLVFSSLLPFWAAFWKACLQKSPETTHRPHVGWPD